MKTVFKGCTRPRQKSRIARERRDITTLFFLCSLTFLRASFLLYCISLVREFLLTVYLLWSCPFVFLYCIRIFDLVLHSGKLFLPHLFICIMFLFLLGFLRFILFYISYICEHFDCWIFYASHLFNSLPIWVIYSLYPIFCMYAHLLNFFYPSICLSFYLLFF